jgi:hypothetical protein
MYQFPANFQIDAISGKSCQSVCWNIFLKRVDVYGNRGSKKGLWQCDLQKQKVDVGPLLLDVQDPKI